MRRQVCGLGAALATLLAALPAPAHHSVPGQFDVRNTVELTGVIRDVEWINPHVYIALDVEDAGGSVVTWNLATLPTAMLRKAGLTKEMLMGDGRPVTVRALTARDQTRHLGWTIIITYADGHHYQLSEDYSRASAATEGARP